MMYECSHTHACARAHLCNVCQMEGEEGPIMARICFSFSLYVHFKYMCGESCEFLSLTFVDIKPSYYHIPVKRGGQTRPMFSAFYALAKRKGVSYQYLSNWNLKVKHKKPPNSHSEDCHGVFWSPVLHPGLAESQLLPPSV